MVSNKQRIMIFNWLFKLYRQDTLPGDRTKKMPNFTSPLTDPNYCYEWSLNPDVNRQLKYVNISNRMFEFLNVTGDMIIYGNNIEHLNIDTYSCGEVRSENLAIKTPGSVSIHLHDRPKPTYSYDSPEVNNKCENLDIECCDYSIELNDLKSLKTFKLNLIKPINSGHNYYGGYYYREKAIDIQNCPNLKEIDISSLKFMPTNKLKLADIPTDCKIKLNPNLKLSYDLKIAFRSANLKNIFSFDIIDYQPDEVKHMEIEAKKLFPNKQNENPIEVSVLDFYKAINKEMDVQQLNFFKEMQEHQKQIEYYIEHPEEYKKFLQKTEQNENNRNR